MELLRVRRDGTMDRVKAIPPSTADAVIDTLLEEAVRLCSETDVRLASCLNAILERSTSPNETQADHGQLPAVTALRMLDYLSREGGAELGMRRNQIEISIAIIKAWLPRRKHRSHLAVGEKIRC